MHLATLPFAVPAATAAPTPPLSSGSASPATSCTPSSASTWRTPYQARPPGRLFFCEGAPLPAPLLPESCARLASCRRTRGALCNVPTNTPWHARCPCSGRAALQPVAEGGLGLAPLRRLALPGRHARCVHGLAQPGSELHSSTSFLSVPSTPAICNSPVQWWSSCCWSSCRSTCCQCTP